MNKYDRINYKGRTKIKSLVIQLNQKLVLKIDVELIILQLIN